MDYQKPPAWWILNFWFHAYVYDPMLNAKHIRIIMKNAN
jgi:hypothetical protein